MGESEEIKILGIRRAHEHSLNNVDKDEAVLKSVMYGLSSYYKDLYIIDEESIDSIDYGSNVLINMCRRKSSLAKLRQCEGEGKLVINSVDSIEKCAREKMIVTFREKAIPQPDSLIINTHDNIVELLRDHDLKKFWIKRGDGQTQEREDIICCGSHEEAQALLERYRRRNIDTVVVSEHLEGDLVKFYGVRGQPFFYWFYPEAEGYDKFGDGKKKETVAYHKFDLTRLKFIASKASEVLGLDIYGGDCIIGPSGDIRIIDFNDWPSFSPCREEAVGYIVKNIVSQIESWRI